MSYNLQSTSSLFLVPIEIRRAIYADLIDTAGIHITLSPQGRIRLTRCLDPELSAGHLGGERRPPPSADGSGMQKYRRRLASTWGPHWECEEVALADGEEGTDGSHAGSRNSFLATCKRLLPLQFFEALAIPDAAPLDENVRVWLALPRNLEAHLPSLQLLRVWLDHTDKVYWSAVDERAVLRPFEPLVTNNPHLTLSLELPKLHHLDEDPLCHFLEDKEGAGRGCKLGSSPRPIQVRRRLRQRYLAGP
ncbi:hypothetical protein PG997_010932 [Apiospora hydei]|uniref:Uncharacterized protein n=1 Tax=Apiospora hydei TaxID=1337664 RepID=A0ABR1VLC3_9PEZI